MNDIPTWHERAMRHPDHQSGMVSEDMLRARMTEEIVDLRAEVDRQRAEIERLRAEMLELAEWCEAEEPLSHKKLSQRLRAALEDKP